MAVAPTAPLGKYTPAERRHWAFQKRSNPPIPTFAAPKDRAWAKTPVDAFVLARLQKEGLPPAAPADRETLIRRISFDLTGLPPTPSETAAFVKDRSPGAYENLVERLLNSPHYGERWGQHWLDVVRFAETDGFEYDTHRRDAWRYRDYVIRAFNNDKPYDRFLTEQLAGDEIAPKEDETLIAAGFNRLGPLRKNAGNQEVASSRNEVLTEMTNIVGSGVLGVTLGCARCHDHKFDPYRQSDYYRMQGFFAATFENNVSKATPEEESAWKAKDDPIEQEIKDLRKSLKGKQGDEAQAIVKKLETLEDGKPEPLPSLFSVKDDTEHRTEIHLLQRGDYQNKGDKVGMRALGILLPENSPELPESTPKPRAELAKWITGPNNPLTARVMANRIWEYHFGRGIVATPNDFGRMGERPTNPELLDYLANEFVASGWSVKHLHRLILMSNTYRQAGGAPNEKDPDDKLLSSFPRRRLEAEEIRDAMLAAAGDINSKPGGPSVIVPIDAELVKALYKPSQWAPAKDPAEYQRRSVYLIAKRNLRLPFMEVFDSPDLQVSCPRRESSTHAPQALEMLNGTLANRQAKALSDRLGREAGKSRRKEIDLAYLLVTGRSPKPPEVQLSLKFLNQNSKILGEEPAREQFALAMFNLNAFLYID
ncbi:MAG: DUF1549 and DUF1553 domain-containing protein [Acidobacteriota bacterium]|nr:DUF1549 and DUF1553 domain-containing protein [Acidobacteriota bacterium]